MTKTTTSGTCKPTAKRSLDGNALPALEEMGAGLEVREEAERYEGRIGKVMRAALGV